MAYVMLRCSMVQGQDSNLEGFGMGMIPSGECASICSESSGMNVGWYTRDKSDAANDIDYRCHCCWRRRRAAFADASPCRVFDGASNAAAAEWVHARLMGFDPRHIPLLLGAFSNFSGALTDFPADTVLLRCKEAQMSEDKILPVGGRAFTPAQGWRGHCELNATRNN